MKKHYFILLLCALGLNACKKQDVPPAPVADFSLDSKHSSSLTLREGTLIIPVNNSTNAVSYLWDLGNGKTSTEKTPGIYFDNKGDFTITLTATNRDGSTVTTKKQVKVLGASYYAVQVDNLNDWNGFNFSSLKKFTGGEVWVEIRLDEHKKTYNELPDKSYDYALYYKSPVVTATPLNGGKSLEIPFPEKVYLKERLKSSELSYSFNLYVKDANGTHLLFTSLFVGSSSYPTDLNSLVWSSTVNGTKATLKAEF